MLVMLVRSSNLSSTIMAWPTNSCEIDKCTIFDELQHEAGRRYPSCFPCLLAECAAAVMFRLHYQHFVCQTLKQAAWNGLTSCQYSHNQYLFHSYNLTDCQAGDRECYQVKAIGGRVERVRWESKRYAAVFSAENSGVFDECDASKETEQGMRHLFDTCSPWHHNLVRCR